MVSFGLLIIPQGNIEDKYSLNIDTLLHSFILVFAIGIILILFLEKILPDKSIFSNQKFVLITFLVITLIINLVIVIVIN